MKKINIIIYILCFIFMLLVGNANSELLQYQKDFIYKYYSEIHYRPSIVLAICGVESNFGKYTNGHPSDLGVMQIRLCAARDAYKFFSKSDYQPSDKFIKYYLKNSNSFSLVVGDIYLERLYSHYKDINKSILAYNRGMGSIYRNPNIDPNNYLKKVLTIKNEIDILLLEIK